MVNMPILLGTGGRGGRGPGIIGTIAAAGCHNATPTAEHGANAGSGGLPADTDVAADPAASPT